jgi:hypothetical protein
VPSPAGERAAAWSEAGERATAWPEAGAGAAGRKTETRDGGREPGYVSRAVYTPPLSSLKEIKPASEGPFAVI